MALVILYSLDLQTTLAQSFGINWGQAGSLALFSWIYSDFFSLAEPFGHITCYQRCLSERKDMGRIWLLSNCISTV